MNNEQEVKKYEIELCGCHSETVFEIDLTDEQLKTVERIAKKSAEVSEYICMPVLKVREIKDESE